jgi:hypothetical protein
MRRIETPAQILRSTNMCLERKLQFSRSAGLDPKEWLVYLAAQDPASGVRLKTTESRRFMPSRGSPLGTKVALAVKVTEAFAGTLNTCVSGCPMR